MKLHWLFYSIFVLVLYRANAANEPSTVTPNPPAPPDTNDPGDSTTSHGNAIDYNNETTTPIPSVPTQSNSNDNDSNNNGSDTTVLGPQTSVPAQTPTQAPPKTNAPVTPEQDKTTVSTIAPKTNDSATTKSTEAPPATTTDATNITQPRGPMPTEKSKTTITPANPPVTTVTPTEAPSNPPASSSPTVNPNVTANPPGQTNSTNTSQTTTGPTKPPVNPTEKTTTTESSKTTEAPQPTKTAEPTNTPTEKPTDKPTEPPTNPPTQNQPTTTKKTDTGSTVSPTKADKQVFINEISVDKNGVFKQIELQVSSELDKSNYAVALVKGQSLTPVKVIYLENETMSAGNYMLLNLDNMDPISDGGMGFAIYNIHTRNSAINEGMPLDSNGLVDALVIGKKYENIDGQLVNTLTPDMNPFVLDPSLYGTAKSISRCSYEFQRRTDMYALLDPSMGENNKDRCDAIQTKQSSIELQLTGECGSFLYKNNTARDKNMLDRMVRSVVKEVNRKCHCGITQMHVMNPRSQCCRGSLNLKMTLTASTDDRVNNFKSSFNVFRKQTTQIDVDGTQYPLDSKCFERCCEQPQVLPHPQTDNTKEKNVKVTVAVIVTCLLVFLVILGVVIIYMKRKKKAVYQFRMSRLQEDDDDDQDDFIGGQEATFDVKP